MDEKTYYDKLAERTLENMGYSETDPATAKKLSEAIRQADIVVRAEGNESAQENTKPEKEVEIPW